MTRALGFVLALLAFAPVPALAGPRWGVEAGAQWGRFAEGRVVGAEREWSPGPALGLTLESRLGPVGIASGLRFLDQREQKRSTLAFDPGTGPVTYALVAREHLLTFSVPMDVVWPLPHGLRIEAGPEVRWLARATLQTGALGPSPLATTAVRDPAPAAVIFETVGDTPDVTRYFDRWSVGMRAGFGVRWPLDTHEAGAALRYARGLTRVSGEVDEGARAQGFEFALGLTW